MPHDYRLRRVLPIVQTVAELFFGGLGIWQRNQILGRSGWNSTARFHVWPWPLKFIAIVNLPALSASTLLSMLAIGLRPALGATVVVLFSILTPGAFCYWIGCRLDESAKRRRVTQISLLLLFTLLAAIGTLLPLGYVGYVPYGIVLWLLLAFGLRVISKAPSDRR